MGHSSVSAYRADRMYGGVMVAPMQCTAMKAAAARWQKMPYQAAAPGSMA